MTIIHEPQPALTEGPIRARCPECTYRFPWPDSAAPTALEPYDRPEMSCPNCHQFIKVVEEPRDDNWWAYVTGSWGDDTEPEVTTNPRPKKAAVPVLGGSIE